jgi:hypothetical protein
VALQIGATISASANFEVYDGVTDTLFQAEAIPMRLSNVNNSSLDSGRCVRADLETLIEFGGVGL